MRHKWLTLFSLETKRFLRNSHHFFIPFLIALWIILVFSLLRQGTQITAEDSLYINYALLWLAAGLSFLFGANRFFDADHKNGLLEQIFLGPSYFILLIRILVFTCFHSLFFCVVSLPILWLLLGMQQGELLLFVLTLLLGLPAFCMTLALGAAIGQTSNNMGFVAALISLPLYVPIILLSMLALTDREFTAVYMQWLFALSLMNVALLGLAVEYILRDAAAE